MDSDPRDLIANVLSKVAQAVKRLDEAELEAFTKGEFQVELVVGNEHAKKTRRRKESTSLSDDSCREITQMLNEMDDRQKGLTLLNDRCPTKDGLVQLTRYLDLPLQKKEPVDRLTEKIIEATIGYRLRSRAIQGEETK